MATPTGGQEFRDLVAFVRVETELVKVGYAVSALLVHRPIAEGREQLAGTVSSVEMRKLRNWPEAG